MGRCITIGKFAATVKAVKRNPQTVIALSEGIGINKNTAQNYLALLYDEGLVDRKLGDSKGMRRAFVYTWQD